MIDLQTITPDTLNKPLRVALAHDWLVGYRGGEMVLEAIAQLLIDAGHSISRIYTMFDCDQSLSPTLDSIERTTSSLNRYPASLRRWLLMRYPAGVRELSQRLKHDHTQEPIDLLISTHSAAIKAITPPTGVPHICYCHSPARYLWSQTDQYASRDLKGRFRALGLRCFAPSLRRWDRSSTDSVTDFIANSSHTAREIERCYQRESVVVHPPVRTEFFTPDDSVVRSNQLLLVSALEPYKRIDLAIDAACLANRPLTIVGSGSHEQPLRAHAQRAQQRYQRNNLIRFAGKVSDEALREHYRIARAFLFPQIEDFGITAVESQSCACPVIARRAGGALDSIIENQTGTFFDDPTPEAIVDAIERCPEPNECADACRFNAQRFSHRAFILNMNQIIADSVR